MKFTTKSAATLVALLAVSTVGGKVAFADLGKELDSTGTVEVGDATDTGDKGKLTLDPETKGYLEQPGDKEMVIQTVTGPVKIERVPNLNFGKIEPQANDIVQNAKDFGYKKNTAAKDQPANYVDVRRGAIIQFADVRNAKDGYKVMAQMTQQFTSGANKLDGATVTFGNGILKIEDSNENKAPKLLKTDDLVLAQGKDSATPGAAVEVVNADQAAKEGKGRYAIEYGQSETFNKDDEFAGKGNGVAKTATESVKLAVPNKTASNMAKGSYEAKITWSIVEAQ